jgi:hypothetical protein
MKSGRIGTGMYPFFCFCFENRKQKKKKSRPQHGRVRRGRENYESHPFFLMNEFPLTMLVFSNPWKMNDKVPRVEKI